MEHILWILLIGTLVAYIVVSIKLARLEGEKDFVFRGKDDPVWETELQKILDEGKKHNEELWTEITSKVVEMAQEIMEKKRGTNQPH